MWAIWDSHNGMTATSRFMLSYHHPDTYVARMGHAQGALLGSGPALEQQVPATDRISHEEVPS
jgi:hypothetical protein